MSMSASASTSAAAATAASPAMSGLPPAPVPLDQLQQIQRRIQALVASIGQLNMEIAVAPALDWPGILSRFGTLVSQTYSLSSSLTSSSSAFLPAQFDALHKHLEEEARTRNYFMNDDDDGDGGAEAEASSSAQAQSQVDQRVAVVQAQVGSKSELAALKRAPRVRYVDGSSGPVGSSGASGGGGQPSGPASGSASGSRSANPLPRLAALPIVPLDGDKTARLGEALRTKLDPDVTAAQDALLAAEVAACAALDAEGGQAGTAAVHAAPGAPPLDPEAEGEARLIRSRSALDAHDLLARRALRAWYHVRWRPDEVGDVYDFKMRLGEDDTGELDEEGEGEGEGEGEEDGFEGGVGAGAANGTAGIAGTGAEIPEDELLEDYEADGDEEEEDEEMEDVV